VVGDTGKHRHRRPRGQGRERGREIGVGGAHAEPENAAMDREADGTVHHRLRRGVDRHPGGEPLQQRHQSGDPLVGDQQRAQAVRRPALDEGLQHHLALGHEHSGAADEIALAHVAETRDAGIGGIGDGKDFDHGGNGVRVAPDALPLTPAWRR
jgi:hypothetical protein